MTLQLDEDTLANVVRSARYFLKDQLRSSGQSVPAAVLDAAVLRAVRSLIDSPQPGEHDFYAAEASRQIMEGLRIQIAPVKVLVDGPHIDWYVGERRGVRPYWDRYKKLLAHEYKFDETTVASVDRSSDRIVEQLGDPRSEGPFDRRGLVVGQVQSGKTTNYAAVLNKAIDAGYKVIVVLTGIHESLRVQTQKRLEETVTGVATESGKQGGPAKGEFLPLAEIKAVVEPPHPFTTRAIGGDFSRKASQYAAAIAGTHFFVIKKNVTILRELARHFEIQAFQRAENHATQQAEIVGRALLVIDDEADNASVDVNRPDPDDLNHDPTAINRAIRRLLMQFRQRAYIGYTATPYANILIHKDNETAEVGPDLFPQDFIVMLPAPSNYVGPSTFFGSTSVSDDDPDGDLTPPLLRFVDDCGQNAGPDDWMPRGHKKVHVPRIPGREIPRSLEDAVMSFVLATAVRHLRGRITSHNSMLVHVSRYKDVQVRVRAALHDFVYRLKGALSDESGSADLVARFGALYELDFRPTTASMDSSDRGFLPPLPEVKSEVRKLLDSLMVWTVNSEAQNSLDYDQYPNGLNVICVGGDKLSRGLTLEGLTVSYFLRASRMYDTLMQMGRWFGYRPGYKDLCRLYLTKELARWYQHVARADEELRAEFLMLEDEHRRPSDFGLRVRSHPTLLVTAPAKMSSSQEFRLDFGGRVSQTIHFFRDPVVLRQNAEATAEFLGKLGSRAATTPLVRRDPSTGDLTGKQPLPGYLYTNVPLKEVVGFLRAYRFHPDARTVSAPQLLEFLRKLEEVEIETFWSVVVASGDELDVTDAKQVTLGEGVSVAPVIRATKPPTGVIEWSESVRSDTIVLGVLSSPTDLVADLRPSEVERLRRIQPAGPGNDSSEQEYVARSRACLARDENHCLLVLYYAIQPTVRGEARVGTKRERLKVKFAPGSNLPIGLAIALPRNSRMPSVTYVVNSVLIDELEARYESTGERGEAS